MEEQQRKLKIMPDLTGVDLDRLKENYAAFLDIGNLPEDQWDGAVERLMEKVRRDNPMPQQK
jgi:hypothetical protein